MYREISTHNLYINDINIDLAHFMTTVLYDSSRYKWLFMLILEAWQPGGKNILCAVRLLHLPDGRRWDGLCAGRLWFLLMLLPPLDIVSGRCPEWRGGWIRWCSVPSAPLSAELSGRGWSGSSTTLCTACEQALPGSPVERWCSCQTSVSSGNTAAGELSWPPHEL